MNPGCSRRNRKRIYCRINNNHIFKLFLLTSTVYKKQHLKTVLQIQNNKSVKKKSTRFLKPMDILQSFLTAAGYCILLKL